MYVQTAHVGATRDGNLDVLRGSEGMEDRGVMYGHLQA